MTTKKKRATKKKSFTDRCLFTFTRGSVVYTATLDSVRDVRETVTVGPEEDVINCLVFDGYVMIVYYDATALTLPRERVAEMYIASDEDGEK